MFSRPSGGGSRAAPSDSATVVAPAVAAPASNGAAPLQAVSVSGEVSTNGVLSPAAVYARAAEMGAYKASLPWWKIVLLGAVAGCYVSLGGALLLTVAPNCPGLAASNPGLQRYLMGAIGFPFALLAILTCGSELFTGNTALLTTAVYEGKADLKGLAKSWVCSYLGNIIGCAIGIALFANSGLLPQLKTGAEALALYKTASPLKETFLKAIAANWFVCLAVWQSIAAQSFGGKFIACLGPVSAFVCVGLEHCIANMFFVPLGILVGAKTTMWDFVFNNLIPVTLGNIFAGVVCVATVYSLVYGKLGKKVMGEA
jgi:formate transporter